MEIIKTILIGILLILWMVLTLVLVCSMIGMFALMDNSWYDFGRQLLNKIK